MALTNDIGLNPPTKEVGHRRAATVKTGETNIKFGAIVQGISGADHDQAQTTTTAGDIRLMGVCQSQGDPNNSGLFSGGDVFDCQDEGDCQVLILGSTTVNYGDPIISSTTAGVGKVLAAETGADVLGYARQSVTTGANPQLVSMKLSLSRRGS